VRLRKLLIGLLARDLYDPVAIFISLIHVQLFTSMLRLIFSCLSAFILLVSCNNSDDIASTDADVFKSLDGILVRDQIIN